MSWDEKVVLVAGVGGGLGTAVVSALAASGAAVVAVARSRPALEALESAARGRGWRLRVKTADLVAPGPVEAVVAEALSEFGRLDAACVTAGRWAGPEPLLHETSDAQWTGLLRDNLDPIYRVGRAVLPAMVRQREGALVLVGASEPIRRTGSAAYAAAKAGIAELARKLASDYRPFGIRVNAVLPGSMGHDAPYDPPTTAGVRPRNATPNAPWEVARAIRYLLSDEGRWVTGAALVVDGGSATQGTEPAE